MAASVLPPAGISLRGAGGDGGAPATGRPSSCSAILFKLSDDVLRDLQRASKTKDGVRFVAGSAPKLRLGGRTIDLGLAPDAFRNQLFASTSGSSAFDFTFTAAVSHRAELKVADGLADDTSGSDAALAALQNSLASYQQEKQLKQANITNSVLPAPKNRFDAARKEKQDKRRGVLGRGQAPQSSFGATATPRLGTGPTSAPTNEDEMKLKAMRTPLIHLLAMRPTTADEIRKATHIPRESLDGILQKVGRLVDGKWQLSDRAYKDLNVWTFAYPSPEDREAAIEGAIKAYDRLRLGKDDELWQLLLPKAERGKGKVLSRLHLGGVAANKAPSSQPQLSPTAHGDDAVEGKPRAAAATASAAASNPRAGTSTPRPNGARADAGSAIVKRLLSKNPQKARAVDQAKDRKRKDRDTAASDLEAGNVNPPKRQMTKPKPKPKANPNIKSEEFVYSSDEDEDDVDVGRASEKRAPAPPKPHQREAAKATTARTDRTAASANSSESSDVPIKAVKAVKAAEAQPKVKPTSTPDTVSKTPAVSRIKPSNPQRTTGAAGKSTPRGTTVNLSAPAPQGRTTQRSPSKTAGTAPSVPSPLGAARPRVASDVSDRGAVGVQRVRQGPDTTMPKGLGISNANITAAAAAAASGPRKRHDTVTSADSSLSTTSQLKTPNGTTAPKTIARPRMKEPLQTPTETPGTKNSAERPPAANGTETSKALSNGTTAATTATTATHKMGASGVKRRAAESPQTNDVAAKHRKTDSSTSSHAIKPQGPPPPGHNKAAAAAAAARASPTDTIFDTVFDSSSSSDSAGAWAVLDDISYSQGVSMAQAFRDRYYPRYASLYDELEARERAGRRVEQHERDRLWAMHRRLAQMKREIVRASEKEGLIED